MQDTVSINVNIQELDEIIYFHKKAYIDLVDMIEDLGDRMTLSGKKISEVAADHQKRYRELNLLKDSTWPK